MTGANPLHPKLTLLSHQLEGEVFEGSDSRHHQSQGKTRSPPCALLLLYLGLGNS